MTRTFATKALLILILLTAAVGVADAALEQAWDHLVIFGASAALALALAAEFSIGRPVVSVRRDLVHWLTRRSHLTGETVEQVIDRAIDTHIAAIDPPAGERHDDELHVDR